MCSGEVCERTLEQIQGVVGQLEVVFCHAVWPAATRDEAKLASFVLSSELANAVVRPLVDDHTRLIADDDCLSVEVDVARSSIVANIGEGAGWKLCKEGEKRGGKMQSQ